MTKLRAVFLAAAALAVCAAGALGQSPSTLPPGLVQQGSVVMMHPIQDSENNGPTITGERRVGLVGDRTDRADRTDRGDMCYVVV